MSVKRYSVWEDEMFDEKHALNPKNSMVHLMVMHEDYAALEARSAALAAENAGLNAFVDALLSIAWQGGSADGAEIQEMALKHGLLRQEVYSDDEHETLVDDPGNFEDGDPVYFRVENPVTEAYLAEVRASGVEMMVEQCESDIMLIEPGDEEHYILMIEHAKEFAAQIRKEAAQ